MATVHDVAAYILEKLGPMTAMKLQKLVYYSQAWALVWDEKPLFPEEIQAWAMGPVVPELYAEHRGQYKIERLRRGSPNALAEDERDTVEAVLTFYGNKSSQWLSDLTHQEKPWLDARRGYAPGEQCNNVITLDAMAEYYSSMPPQA